MSNRDIFSNMCPLDVRYYDEEVAEYLSENARIAYQLEVEAALAYVLYLRGKCSKKIYREIKAACKKINAEQVYAEESRIGHDIRALANCIRSEVSDKSKPFVHFLATSYDIIDTANALRYRHVIERVMIPYLKKLNDTLAEIALREAYTVQIGRTHGQHAVPITFGLAIAGYLSRIDISINYLELFSSELCGKFSGAVGAYNASSLFFDDPEDFELEILRFLGLGMPADHSTQIVPPEPLVRLLSEVTIVSGIMADLADSMRNLQRTEIAEIGEAFDAMQVGSSTMPQKRNPINFENVKSTHKIVAPRMQTVYLDQISEHQRDLTNSASSRTYVEMIAYTVSAIKRLTRTMGRLVVNHENMKRNLEIQGDLILAEPLYIILAALGHSNAHEKAREITLEAQQRNCSILSILESDPTLDYFYQKIKNKEEKYKLPETALRYVGIAADKATRIANDWIERSY